MGETSERKRGEKGIARAKKLGALKTTPPIMGGSTRCKKEHYNSAAKG